MALSLPGLVFPFPANLSQETCAGGTILSQGFIAARSIVAHCGTADEKLWFVLCFGDRPDQRARRIHTAEPNSVLLLR